MRASRYTGVTDWALLPGDSSYVHSLHMRVQSTRATAGGD